MSINITQQSKTREYLQGWRARPGHKLVQFDLSAVEPVVLAEASRDKTLMSLYGPDAKPNDVYLYNAANISVWSDIIRTVYDPNNPTPESLSKAKKQFKGIRQISKTVHLAKQYMAGTKKIYMTLLENNVVDDDGKPLSMDVVEQICKDWHTLYQGISDFNNKLKAEWEFNRGWIYNAVYRPIMVHETRTKDLVNAYCQSSGHEILLMMLQFIAHERKRRRIEMYPWIVDYHDETIWEVSERDVDRVLKLYDDAFTDINERLGGEIPIKGTPTVADS